MKSKVAALCKSIQANKLNFEVCETLIFQYISAFELDPNTLSELSNDTLFPQMVQQFLDIICVKSIPKSPSPIPEIITTVLQFFISIISVNPAILDIVAASANLDTLVPQFFSANITDGHLSCQCTSYLYHPIKFIAYVSLSKKVVMTTTPSTNMLIQVLYDLLSNPQLAAWSGSIIAGMCQNNQTFVSLIQIHPLIRAIKQDLSELLPSCDKCVVMGALSATVMLASLGIHTETAMSASIQFIAEDLQFPLTCQLAGFVITLLAKKIKISFDQLQMILRTALDATGLKAHALFQLLINLNDLHYQVTDAQGVRALMRSIVANDDITAISAGCHFLCSIYDSYPDLFEGIDPKGHLFKKLMLQLMNIAPFSNTERIETILMLFKLLICNNALSESTVLLLESEEDAILMDFVRHIENNDSYISVCYFNFLMICTKSIPRWILRIKRLLIDTQFPALVVHVLTTSHNRRAIEDALTAIQTYLAGCQLVPKDGYFFSSTVSGYLMINNQRVQETEAEKQQQEVERHAAENALHSLEQHRSKLEKENTDLKDILSEEKQQSQQSSDGVMKLSEELEEIKKVITKKQNKIENLVAELGDVSEKLNSADSSNKHIRKENQKLKKKVQKYHGIDLDNDKLRKLLEQVQNENIDLENKVEFYTKQSAQYKKMNEKLQQDLNEKEDQIVSNHRRVNEVQQRIKTLESKLDQDNDTLTEKNGDLQEISRELQNQQQANAELSEKINKLEAENIHIRQQIQSGEIIKQKYKSKKSQLKQRLAALEKEKKRWESIAKFVNRVDEVKSISVFDVYGSTQDPISANS